MNDQSGKFGEGRGGGGGAPVPGVGVLGPAKEHEHKIVFRMTVDFTTDPNLPEAVRREELSRHLRAASKRILKKSKDKVGSFLEEGFPVATWEITS